MLAYARAKAPEAAASQQPYVETLKSKYQNFLVSALILVLIAFVTQLPLRRQPNVSLSQS